MSESFNYKVVLKRHRPSTRSDVCVFYDDDRKTALKEMQRYVKTHGFTIDDKDGRFTIADVLLVKQTYTGEVISETPYCKLFDVLNNELKGGAE